MHGEWRWGRKSKEQDGKIRIRGSLRYGNHDDVPREHRQVALDFLAASNAEFERGDVLQGTEMLWGAVAHAVMAVAQERGWDHNSHRSLKNAVVRLAEEYDNPSIRLSFAVAEKFHKHFYHDWMEKWEREPDRPEVHDLVHRLLASEKVSMTSSNRK